MWIEVHKNGIRLSRYTYKCVVSPGLGFQGGNHEAFHVLMHLVRGAP